MSTMRREYTDQDRRLGCIPDAHNRRIVFVLEARSPRGLGQRSQRQSNRSKRGFHVPAVAGFGKPQPPIFNVKDPSQGSKGSQPDVSTCI